MKGVSEEMIDELDAGFLLTIPGSTTGRIKKRRNRLDEFTIHRIETGREWDSYTYLKIHRCRKCDKYYVIDKGEIYLEVNISKRPTNVTHATCKQCLNMEVGVDEPLEEFPIPHKHLEYLKGF